MRKFRDALRQALGGPAGILFAAALLLYLPGLWWGLPYATAAPRALPWGTDELAPLQSVTELYGVFFAHHPHFNPQYPLFQNFMQALFVAPYLLFAWLTGALRHPQPLYPFGFTDPVTSLRITTILARGVSWLMAAGVVATAYHTGKVLKDRLTGWGYGLFVLCIYPMFYYSRTSNVDMGALFWSAIGMFVFAKCLCDGVTIKRAVLLGVFGALATASKDASWPAFFVAAVLLAGMEMGWPPHRIPREKMRMFAAAFLVAVAVYVVASGLVFRPSRYVEHLHWITGRGIRVAGRMPATWSGYAGLAAEIGRNAVDALGLPMAIGSLIGMLLCWFRERHLLQWILPPIGIVVFVLGPARYVLLRFLLVIGYMTALFAVLALRYAWESPVWRKAAPAVAVVILGWSLARGGDLTLQMLHDPRYEAASWLHRHAAPGSRVLHFENPCGLPALDTGVRNIWVKPAMRYEFKHTAEDPEFIVLVPYQLFPKEMEHEPNLPERDYQGLRDGSLSYQQVMRLQAPRLLERQPLPFVNPLVQVFVRKDLLARESR